MSLWMLGEIIFATSIFLAVAILWIRQSRPPKEDPRLSRGLQLLQSKISVLEDLSDRTENQVRQLIQILDEKARGLQNKMLQAQDTVRQIENAMHKSLNVAEIFQDKIPHQEIIERNQQSKYVLAAKLANAGQSVDEILKQVDLPRSEVEFIAKVNRDDLTFDPTLLPEWAKTKVDKARDLESQMVERVFQAPKTDFSALEKIERKFKDSVREVEAQERAEADRLRQIRDRNQALKQTAEQVAQGAMQMTHQAVHATQNAVQAATQNLVRKVQFPRITVDRPRWRPATKE